MADKQIIANTKNFVKETLKNAEGGHDWFHIQRVLNNAKTIAQQENVNTFVVELGALLHDIADSKFHNGDESLGPRTARKFLKAQGVDKDIIVHVAHIVEFISFKGGNETQEFTSPELKVVQDADRLDAMGAIGISRAFNYGGFKGRPLHNPEIKPNLKLSKAEYKVSTAPTINHFYEKLLLLKDRMNTETGKKMAMERHQFMELFLEEFYKEWGNEQDIGPKTK